MPSRIENPALFLCDIQEKFRPAIHAYPHVIATAQKLVKASTHLKIPIYITTQNSARLGPTCAELLDLVPDSHKTEIDKTAFSMMVPELTARLTKQATAEPSAKTKPFLPVSVILVGIETHICVTQTALDLLAMGHKVYVCADGVSSCNAGERPVAIERLRAEGCTVTTSESVLFELLGDASVSEFKAVSGVVKETKEATKGAVEGFCLGL